MDTDWKGQLGYKDQSGNFWLIGVEDFEYTAANTDGVILREADVISLLAEIDDAPEWLKAEPQPNIQMQALDRGAFPNATESHIDIVKRRLDATESHIELGTE